MTHPHLLFQEIQDALCREGKLLPDLGVATFQLLAETTLGPTAYHLTDGFTTGSVATLTAGIEEGELLRELGEEQGVTRFIDWDSLVVLLLLVETQAKHLHLHGEHVVGHSLGKTDAGICLLSGLLQDVEDNATTEADDGRTPRTCGAAPLRRDYVQGELPP